MIESFDFSRSRTRLAHQAFKVFDVPAQMSCADWADKYFVLPAGASNTSGRWKTTPPQRAILNAFGSDAIQEVTFFKPTRLGGTKMLLASQAYYNVHKRRTTLTYQPSNPESREYVLTEVQPALNACPTWQDLLLDKRDSTPSNNLNIKMFAGANALYKGGHTPNNYRRITASVVQFDELDALADDIGGEGAPDVLGWNRTEGATFRKLIRCSTPTIKGGSLIERAAQNADDVLECHVKCPNCGQHAPIEWGGPDLPYGFEWKENDPESVLHYCMLCGDPWANNQLTTAYADCFWKGSKGYSTRDGLEWMLDGQPTHKAPRHVAFWIWSAYSPFSPWTELVQGWLSAQGDIPKIKTFTNTKLAKTWDLEGGGSINKEFVSNLIPTDDLSAVTAVTAGIDTQGDRLEIQYLGHDRKQNTYVLGYDILFNDPENQMQIWQELFKTVLAKRFQCGDKTRPVLAACIDTQGNRTEEVHRFLMSARSKSKVFVGVNGTGRFKFKFSDKKSEYSKIKGSEYYSIGVNLYKTEVYSSLKNHDADAGSFRIWVEADLPEDYGEQLTVEKMEHKHLDGKDRVVFTNKRQKRNEAMDTAVYALAARDFIKKTRGKRGQALFQ